MDLFDSVMNNKREPLAFKMRPRTLEEIVGQDHILGEGKLLRRAIAADRLGSIILYGPPGCGKTSIAEIIASSTNSEFVRLNAVTAGVADIRRVVEQARDTLKMYDKGTILFVDEIHRFNRSQQDALLPHVENGTITLIGATTENPFFEVNAPLLSRSRILTLKLIEKEDIKKVLLRAASDIDRGLGKMNVKIDDDALDHLADFANGDARAALNALELAAFTTRPNEAGDVRINLKTAEDSIQRRALKYSDGGDTHYDVTSAFIKSMRGSDPNAALHYLARMIESGEDPKFIARRLVVHASEDVGMADPMAMLVAMAAASAVDRVGLPEARIPLAEATIYIATAPKSNAAYVAIEAALKDVRENMTPNVPSYLRDASYKGAARLGNGIGYKYPHDYPGSYIEQQYMPEEFSGRVYYEWDGVKREREDTNKSSKSK